MAFLSTKYQQFDYFHHQLGRPDWTKKRVLDFGGNRGNLLVDCNEIDHERYWCIDVDKAALANGQARFPNAHFLHYNRYNHCFNPEGVVQAPLPQTEERFDVIVSYSVFTHTTIEEMLELVPKLTALLTPQGRLAFTFIDHQWTSWPHRYQGNNLKWRLDRIHQTENPNAVFDSDLLLEKAQAARWCTLVNDHLLFVEDEPQSLEEPGSYHTFFTAAFIQKLFPKSRILSPACDEMQHCCVIDAL